MAPEIAVRESGVVRVFRSLKLAIGHADDDPKRRQIMVDGKVVNPSDAVRSLCATA